MCGVTMTFGQVPVRARRIERFLREHVERGAAEAAVPQAPRTDGVVVDQLAAADVDEQRARLDAVQRRRRPISSRVSGVSGADSTTTSLRARRSMQPLRRQHLLDAVRRGWSMRLANAGHAQAERRRERRDLAADGAEADDRQAPPVQRPNRRRSFRVSSSAQSCASLTPDDERQLPRQRDA